MASTTFVNGVTLTDAGWFQDVNTICYVIFSAPSSAATNFLITGTLASGAATITGQLNATATGSVNTSTIKGDVAAASVQILWNNPGAGDNIFTTFNTEVSPAVTRGSIDYNRGGGAVRYNTTSDEALKLKMEDADPNVSKAIIMNTRIREFEWPGNPKKQIGVGARETYDGGFRGAVSVGDDKRPWMVDKTAWNFHLIALAQQHESSIAALRKEFEDYMDKHP